MNNQQKYKEDLLGSRKKVLMCMTTGRVNFKDTLNMFEENILLYGLERKFDITFGINYDITYASLSGLTKALAVEWGKSNIRVNALCPSYVMSLLEREDVMTGRCGYTLEDIESRMPLGRYSEPIEQARACAFLASEDSSFMTETTLINDGGWTIYGGW